MLNFTTVDPATLTADHPSHHATAAELRLAAAAGAAAHAADRPAAPGVDATIQSLVGDCAVGIPRTVELFEAFSGEYQRLADEAAAAVLAGETR